MSEALLLGYGILLRQFNVTDWTDTGPWQKDRWETGLFMSCTVQWCTMGCNYDCVLTNPGRSGAWHQSQARQRSSLMITFFKRVHRHDKNKIWITDAVIKPPPFQSQCQSWNKFVGLVLCLNFPELNPNKSLFWNIWLQSAQAKIRLYTQPFNLFVSHYLSQLIKNINKSFKTQIPIEITCLQLRNPPDGRFM